MADLAHSLAVSVNEIGLISNALPALMGAEHPHADLLRGALSDVATALFAAAGVARTDPTEAATVAAQQLRALRSIQQLATELDPAPVLARELDDAIDLVCGLLELNTGADPA